MFEMKLPCPSCQTVLKVTDSGLIGKKIRCPRCQTAVQIPGGSPIQASQPLATRPMSGRGSPAPAPRQRDLEDQWASQEPEPMEEERPTRATPRPAGKKLGFFGLLLFLLTVGYIALAVVAYLDLAQIPLPGLQ